MLTTFFTVKQYSNKGTAILNLENCLSDRTNLENENFSICEITIKNSEILNERYYTIDITTKGQKLNDFYISGVAILEGIQCRNLWQVKSEASKLLLFTN